MAVRTISTLEVGQHSQDDDAWIALNGVVWDVSGFAARHPGGREVIEKHFGRDGSRVYNDIHSRGLVEKYLGAAKRVGVLEQKEEAEEVSNSSSTTSQLPSLDTIISVYEFEKVAEAAFRPRSWAYIYSSTENGLTKTANQDWYQRIWFRPRVLTGVGKVEAGTTMFGRKLSSSPPIFNSPFSSAMLAHEDGELAIARALGATGHPMIIPTMSSYSVQEIVAALPPGHPFFFQLYVHSDRQEMKKLLDEVCKLGPRGIMVTADLPVMSKREGYAKFVVDEREKERNRKPLRLTTLERPTQNPSSPERPSYNAVDPDLTWGDIQWIRETYGVPVLVKGIQCAADAKRAFDCGCEGIYISNHGGRALDTAAPSILVLLEIQATCPEILDKLEVFIDGGIQRGTDILKAICLGASGVCLGRPFFYALAYGEPGVRRLIESESTLLQREIPN
jgi:L-lactate dehydrogenase (cytochrome)